MDQLRPIQSNYHEIEVGWPEGSLDEKKNYILELMDLEAEVTGMLGIQATVLVADIRCLRRHIRDEIIPAQRKRRPITG